MASAGSDYPKPFLQGLELQDDIPNVVSRSVNIPCVGHCLNSSQLIPIHLFHLKLDKKLTKVPTLGHFERQSHDVRVDFQPGFYNQEASHFGIQTFPGSIWLI
jgi:hypothetical protein